jgi:prepilin peptidase CpaA
MVMWHAGLQVVCILLLLIAAWSDLARRLIPDWCCLGVGLAGALVRVSAGLEPLAWSLGLATGLFVIMVAMHARGWLGGGDVKLIAALGVGLPPLGTLRFLTAMALAGGILAASHLVLRRVLRAAAPRSWARPRDAGVVSRVLALESWRIRRHGPLPYGIAIAAGGIWVLLTGFGG